MARATEGSPVKVRTACWPRDLSAATALLSSYRDFLTNNPAGSIDICLSGYARELEGLEQKYDGKRAALLLAWSDEKAVGCVAVQLLASRPQAAEMKRLFVAPAGRGLGTGRRLIGSCILWAREHGARELLLDTVPEAMPSAVRLYRELGFRPAERYHGDQIAGLAFFRLPLA